MPVHPDRDVLSGDGMAILRDHFAVYRPLVTATALGAATAVFDTVTTDLANRKSTGIVPRLQDSALITLGRAHVQLISALLGCITAARLAETRFAHAETWSCAMKAHGIDTAHNVAAELALLLGATAYRADSRIAKTLKDLGGLLYADGIHDSLYRAAGKHHTTRQPIVPDPRGNQQAPDQSADPATVLT